MGSPAGALKTAARRIGVSVEEYRQRVERGEKWCRGCSDWHPRAAFSADRSRSDGRKATCRAFDRARYDATYEKVPDHLRGPFGPPPAAARDGDKLQARHRINVQVARGRRSSPNDLPCVDCGHGYSDGERRHEYDHHLGYAAEHHEDVEAVCTTCHAARERQRASV